MKSVLVVAPHPDDEVLGVGGTMARDVAAGENVHVVVVTKGRRERFGAEQVAQVQAEAREAHQLLGVTSHFLDLPAAELDTVPAADLNAALGEVFAKVQPQVVYLPHVGDIHVDHQIVFQSAMVCCRPVSGQAPEQVLCYETVSETQWYAAPITPAFQPNVFVDISAHLDKKIAAFRTYASQVKDSPHHRNVKAIEALSVSRGHSVGMQHAEAFMLIRELIR